MKLAVIPARGGSKRIPRKNVRDFCGRPMIAWPISVAQDSGIFDRIVVSTDDEEIARTAREAGADVPFLRGPELADDHTPTRPVIAHAIDTLAAKGWAATEVCCIYATAPFVRPEDLREGLRLLEESGCSYVFPVASYAYPIERALRLDDACGVRMVDAGTALTRSQDLAEAFHDAGQFYWARSAQWREDAPILGGNARALRIPRHRAQDIDTPEDFEMAQLLFEALAKVS